MQPESPYGLQRPSFTASVPPTAPAPVLVPTTAVPAPFVDPRAQRYAYILFACSAAMLLGIGSFNWFTRRDVHVGLGGIQECAPTCKLTMWSDVSHVPADYALFGYVGVLAMAAAIGFSIHAGVMLLRRRPGAVKIRVLNALLSVAAFSTVTFWMRLAFGGIKVSIGYTGFVAIAGILIAGVVVHKYVRAMLAPA